MTQASELALEISNKIHTTLKQVKENKHILRFGLGVGDTANLIEEALTKARLEGAKAMQEAAASKFCLRDGYNDALLLTAIHYIIEALDPQQVISGGVK